MARRTKQEMEQMKSDVRFYLLRTNNQPLPAFELMVKECLESGESIPYYIKNNKDFIKVSQELALELGRKDQMAKRDREQAMAKETIINYILNLSVNEIKSIYTTYKNTVTQSNKLVLHDVYMMIYTDDMKEEYITESAIRLFSTIMEQESQSVEEIAVCEVTEESVIEDVTEQQPVNFTNVETVWNQLKSGNKVLMNSQELDSLQEYIDTLSEDDQDVYYHHFSSLFDKQYACGLLTRSYVCQLKNINKDEVTEELQANDVSVSMADENANSIVKEDYNSKLICNNNKTESAYYSQNTICNSQIRRTQINNDLLQDSG